MGFVMHCKVYRQQYTDISYFLKKSWKFQETREIRSRVSKEFRGSDTGSSKGKIFNDYKKLQIQRKSEQRALSNTLSTVLFILTLQYVLSQLCHS